MREGEVGDCQINKMARPVLFIVCFLATTSHVFGAVSRPNVLFLVVDDLRPKLGCYGETNMLTPNIDQLAARSVRFDRAYVQQAVCSPSRTSFLTGRRPDTTRIYDLVHYFRKVSGNYTTLPQHFKANGYVTQSVGKIFHPGSASGGTDDYPYSWTYPAFHAPTEKYIGFKMCPEAGGKKGRNAVCPVDVKTVPGGSLPDIQNSDFSIQFLHNRSVDGQPFFLGMGYHKPHLPFTYPKEYLDLYPMSKIHLAPNPYIPPWLPQVAWYPYGGLRAYEDIKALKIPYPFGLVPIEYQYKLRQSYSAAASYTDAQVGRVLQALDQYGLANSTIITFHGDHGWQLGDHGTWCKQTNFDIATRIPMMVHVPGVTSKPAPPGQNFPFHDVLDKSLQFRPEQDGERMAEGGVSEALVEAVDLFATITELAGLQVPPLCPNTSFHIPLCTEGVSLVRLIHNATRAMTSLRTHDASGLAEWKTAIFSQYPRQKDTWNMTGEDVGSLGMFGEEEEDEDEAAMRRPQEESYSNEAPKLTIMGYTMRTKDYRYTEWISFDHVNFKAHWNKVHARELYIYSSDPDEDINVAEVEAFLPLVTSLSTQLRAGWREVMPKRGNVGKGDYLGN